jgi:anti-sigma regulatory factor (Ser/Thr protein kinase)
VTDARRWVLHQAASAGVRGDAQATVELLTSELVANALEHGPTTGIITVHTRSGDDGVFEVAVSDEGTGSPVINQPPPTAEGGRGVLLVDVLAEAWGTRPLPGGGKAVWFTVRL